MIAEAFTPEDGSYMAKRIARAFILEFEESRAVGRAGKTPEERRARLNRALARDFYRQKGGR